MELILFLDLGLLVVLSFFNRVLSNFLMVIISEGRIIIEFINFFMMSVEIIILEFLFNYIFLLRFKIFF